MRQLHWATLLGVAMIAAACAAFTVAGQVQSGRYALIMKDPERALAYLLQAAESEPNYIYTSMNFSESVWTYVGRAQYALGRNKEARGSFERALTVYPPDALAQLYFGLTLLRTGDRAEGLRSIQLGLEGLHGWIEHLNRVTPYYAFWDPNGTIRKEIDKTLATISGEREEPIQTIIESAEWIGQQMEEEVDKVRGDERRQFQRDLDRNGRRGFGFGLGIGF